LSKYLSHLRKVSVKKEGVQKPYRLPIPAHLPIGRQGWASPILKA